VKRLSKQVLDGVQHIPIIGPALRCNPKEHWRTSVEIFPGLFWSMLPIWVGTFTTFAKSPTFDWQAFHGAFSGTIAGGELFIYAAAFLAPILWIVHHVPPGADPFPTPIAHGLLTAVVTVFCALSFEMQKPGSNVNPTTLHKLALIFFWTAVILIYLATLYHNHRLPSVSREQIRSQQDKFLERYQERHP
jgi:hypothetical protein